MTTSLLLLRLRIIQRVVAELLRTEPIITVVVLGVLVVAQWQLFAWTGNARGRWFAAACNVAVLLSVHTARRDEWCAPAADSRTRELSHVDCIQTSGRVK
ncbi:MAG: hypothetical protein MUF00_07580 [Gemmatimonadaceae bacterium]|nr:hypothetical protein [Gemmatimonadaceae bacterium]